jgi:hypothetical protein
MVLRCTLPRALARWIRPGGKRFCATSFALSHVASAGPTCGSSQAGRLRLGRDFHPTGRRRPRFGGSGNQGPAGDSSTLHFYACTHKQPLRDKATTAVMRGIALFVTEFGSTPADGGLVTRDPFVCEDETRTWWSWMADNKISGAAWKLDQCTDTSCILRAGAPVDGPWTDDLLSSIDNATDVDGGVRPPSGGGHEQLVVGWIRQ